MMHLGQCFPELGSWIVDDSCLLDLQVLPQKVNESHVSIHVWGLTCGTSPGKAPRHNGRVDQNRNLWLVKLKSPGMPWV